MPASNGPNSLATVIAELAREDGSHATAIPGFYLTRSSTVRAPRNLLSQAVFCAVAQGSKSTLLNGQHCIYSPGQYLLVSLDLPLVGQIRKASRAEPFLGVSLVLDFDQIRTVMREAGLARRPGLAMRPGLVINSMTEELQDALGRLTRLLRKPEQVPILAPLIRREIYYRLLMSEQSGLLQRMAASDSKTRRIAAGLEWMRRNASRTIRVEELARELHMSPSAMHGWFRSVTSMSPLQFQKQLRLHEARRILLSESLDINVAGRRVGYQSPSQFTREYTRLFGAPPKRDIEKLRELN